MWDDAGAVLALFFSAIKHQSYMKRELNQTLSGNEVYYTACS
jgi:hypothetical protein